MNTLEYILIFTTLSGLGSLLGGLFLLTRRDFAYKISHYLTSFAAGTLLATAFLDLLPEAQEAAGESNIFIWVLVGMLILFLLERFIHWFHHHSYSLEHSHNKGKSTIVPLLTLSDILHNFIDGVLIALTFMVSIPLGIITTLAIVAHELPQEIGDFGVMLKEGLSRKKVLLINLFSALSAIVGALVGYFIGESITNIMPIMLAVAAGFFIYIASSDLIPEIHNEHKKSIALKETLLLFGGVVVIWIIISLLEH